MGQLEKSVFKLRISFVGFSKSRQEVKTYRPDVADEESVFPIRREAVSLDLILFLERRNEKLASWDLQLVEAFKLSELESKLT